MRVTLERTVTDHVEHRRYNIYRREDGKFWVLAGPTNPRNATDENVTETLVNTREEAFALADDALPPGTPEWTAYQHALAQLKANLTAQARKRCGS